jgi:hypothetical protein
VVEKTVRTSVRSNTSLVLLGNCVLHWKIGKNVQFLTKTLYHK